MSQKFKVTDASDDRKYFTLVPNYIINHSTHYEQSLYLVMKRMAGESGTCFATQQTIAKIMRCSQPTVSRSIDYLVEHKWIKCIGTKPGRTRPVKEYKIMDIWKMNMDFYNEKDIFTQNKSIKKVKDNQTTEYKIYSPVDVEEEPIRRRTNVIAPNGQSSPKPFKRLEESKQKLVHRIGYFLEDSLNTKIVNWGKQAKGLDMMLKAGYTEDQIKKIIHYMATQDEFFSEKGFDLMTVANNISRFRAEANKNGVSRQ